ncbi:ribonuclease HII [Myxococcota bacterium]|nr:ribonuclease HII [Myxococcota bacterium]
MTDLWDQGDSPAERLRGRPALSAIRNWVAQESDPDRLAAWVSAIASDPRKGAQALAEQWRRRRENVIAERVRVEGLFALQKALVAQGFHCIAGVDEVGVGPLAGPVVAAAVVLPERLELPGLNDSKKLSAASRERLAAQIKDCALAYSLGEVSPEEIDRRNILQATLEAMRRAVSSLCQRVAVDHLMVDARRIPGVSLPQTPLVHGDSIDGSIAAASIVAKVYRDSLMQVLDHQYPGYGLGRHMGYGTADHLAALRRLGPTPIHRRSFAPVASLLRQGGQDG